MSRLQERGGFPMSLGFVYKALVSVGGSHTGTASGKVVVFQASKKKGAIFLSSKTPICIGNVFAGDALSV